MTRPVDRQALPIEGYLLGRLSEEERALVEARLFEDDQLLTTMEDAEEHLIDRYLADELSPQDREAFERHFAASRWRRERVAFRRMLPRALAPAEAAHRPTGVATALARAEVAPPGRGRRSVAWLGLAAALLVLGLGWWARRWPGSTAASPGPFARTTRPDTPMPVPSSSVGPVTPLPPRAALVLHAGLLRAGSTRLPRLRAPAEGDVRLDAELDHRLVSDHGAATLSTVEGRVVWTGTFRTSADGHTATVVLPARLLRPADYVLSLGGSGQGTEDTVAYPFRVVP